MHLELMSCCKRNDLTTGLLSFPNPGKGENCFVSASPVPVTKRMSISNTSGSRCRMSSPKQNTETSAMKKALHRWINFKCSSPASSLKRKKKNIFVIFTIRMAVAGISVSNVIVRDKLFCSHVYRI